MRLAEPVLLASGESSRDFIDAKVALSRGEDLKIACEALLESIGGIDFDAVGGLTMGPTSSAHVLAMLAGREWFVVRKEPKARGTNKVVEGAPVAKAPRAPRPMTWLPPEDRYRRPTKPSAGWGRRSWPR